MVISKLVELMGARDRLRITICPTLREESGLAMSSRNTRLSKDGKQVASAIYQTIQKIRKELRPGELAIILDGARKDLEKAGFKIDYVEVADAYELTPVSHWNGNQKLVILIAAFLEGVRLIDNMPIL
jgi:pantoate--beta-alanine ligase